jgi:hypothetical protein
MILRTKVFIFCYLILFYFIFLSKDRKYEATGGDDFKLGITCESWKCTWILCWCTDMFEGTAV